MNKVTHTPGWSHWVVPRDLRSEPIHRWFVFPHSFTHELAKALLSEWNINKGSTVLDMFVGAGTTSVTSQQMGMNAIGLDISPLATFATRVKTNHYIHAELKEAWNKCRLVHSRLRNRKPGQNQLADFLPEGRWGEFDRWWRASEQLDSNHRDVIRLFILRSIPRIATIRATGGWCSKTDPELSAIQFRQHLESIVDNFIGDSDISGNGPPTQTCLGDARRLPLASTSIDAIITSPPYPNRHDYTRVFGIELAAMALGSKEVKAIRRQSLHSHPESKPVRHSLKYELPQDVTNAVNAVRERARDARIPNMIEGYFCDIAYCVDEMRRVMKHGAYAALVVGNARYGGVPIIVDEWVASIGEERGLTVSEIRSVRIRGNSAQQMGEFGREPSRESVVILRKTKY